MIMKRQNRVITILLCVAVSGFLITEILLNLTPPISRDALIHHLAIPKLWLLHGGFYEIPWADFSYFPMNIDLLYLIPLYFKNDIVPKFIHLAFGFGTGLLIYSYVKNRFNRNWGLLGFLIFFTTPIIVRLSTTAYVDLGMAFFITASILAFVRWRDDGYKNTKWLILSAICMGLAAGSKYNALIAWFFLNLMLIFCYSRDNGKTLPALKYGVVFFAITFLIASPWYIKNYILTANPLYPLFDNFFKDNNLAGAVNNNWTAGIFQRRETMFGEGFWETIFVPVRIFFQGRDGYAQYFDGVLNPILIIMLPFAFLNKYLKRDKTFFFLFSVFFLFMAYFLTVIRVRYILPVIPFLTILSVVGIKNIVEWADKKPNPLRRTGLIGISAVIMILISLNVLYLKDYFNAVQPVRYVLGQETKDEFLTCHMGSYPAVEYINKNLPDNVRISLMFIGRRGYYLDKPYYHEASFGMNTINGMVSASRSKQDFQAYLHVLDCTHILMRIDLFNKYLRDNFSEVTTIRFLDLVKEYWNPIYESNGYVIIKLK